MLVRRACRFVPVVSLVLVTMLVLGVSLPLPPSAAVSTGKVVLALGTVPPDLTAHQFYYALENGFYKDEGIDVQINPVNGDLTAMRALAAGEADVAFTGIAAPLKAVEAGSRIRIISATVPQLDYLLIAQKDIPNVKSLEGRNLGISQPGAVSHQVPKLMIEAAGGDPAKVRFVSVGGSSARILALVAKKIDAAVINTSFAARTAKYDHLHVIGDAGRDLPDFIYALEVVLEKTLQQKRPALQAFVTGTLRGSRWAISNPERAIAISRKILPDVPKEEIVAGIDAFAGKQYWNVDGFLRKEAWEFTIAELVKSGELKRRMNYADVVFTEFTTAAAAKLGTFKR